MQLYKWVADYGTSKLMEFEGNKENSFYSIEKNKLQHFGLQGQKDSYFFDCETGTFDLNGVELDLVYRVGDKTYKLTKGAESYRDIITYKKAEAIGGTGGATHSGIIGFFLGYKNELYFENDIKMSFRAIYAIDLEIRKKYLNVRLVSDTDLQGSLDFYVDGKLFDSIQAPLTAKRGGEINWEMRK